MDNRYKCPHCYAVLKNKTGLNSHLLTHAGIKEFSCSICSRQFSQKAGLDIHMRRIHLDIKPHKCNYCSLTFATPSELKLHRGTHDNPTSFPCPLCPAAFVQKGTLLSHLNSGKHAGKTVSIIYCPCQQLR